MGIRQELARLFGAARETAYQAFWLAVGSLVIAGAISLYAYFTGFLGSPWFYALLGAVAAIACLAIIFAIILAVGTWRRRTLERLERSRYIAGELGTLDHALNLERAQNEMLASMGKIAGESRWLTERINRQATRNSAASRLSGFAQIKAKHKNAARVARDMHASAARVDAYRATFEETVEILEQSILGILNAVGEPSPISAETFEPLRQVTGQLGETTHSAANAQRQYVDAIQTARGVSQELNAAADRLTVVQRGVLDALGRAEKFAATLIDAIEARLATSPRQGRE